MMVQCKKTGQWYNVQQCFQQHMIAALPILQRLAKK